MAEIVILGAGIAGISAAYHAGHVGKNAIVYESLTSWGGLLDHFEIDGFRFDKAIHLSFTNNKYVRSIFDQTPYFSYNPNPMNYENGRWLKHPVQNNIYSLEIQDKIQAIQSFIHRPEMKMTANYKDWLIQQYGEYMANRFPVVYTNKYWTLPPELLSTQWIGNRMYRPDLHEVLHGAMTDQTPNTYYAKEMRYPKKGGYRSFLNPMVEGTNIQTSKRAVRVNANSKYVEFSDGHKVYYDYLLSSIPLPELIPMIDGVPSDIREAALSLWATSVALVSIGLNKPKAIDPLWFYIYDESMLASRVHSPSLKSPDNAPQGCSSLQFEIFFSKYKPLGLSKQQVLEHTIKCMKQMKIATEHEILVADVRIEPYANVVFDHGMIPRRKRVKEYLSSIDIIPIGRFGEWGYLWSDQSLLSGKNAIKALINKKR